MPLKSKSNIFKHWGSALKAYLKKMIKNYFRTVYREYNREFLLPQGTDPELIKSSLSKVFEVVFLTVHNKQGHIQDFVQGWGPY